MKNLKKLFLAAVPAIAFIFTGCIEINTLLTVNKDGSGTLEETVMLSNEIIDMITELQKAFAEDSTQVEPFRFYNEQELKTQAAGFGEEVRYVSSRKIDRENKQGYIVMYEFRDLNKVTVNQNPNSRVKLESFEDEEAEVEEELINFSFVPGDPAEVRIRMPKGKTEEDSVDIAFNDTTGIDTTAMNEQLRKIFTDLRISMALKVNGKIENTNAEYVDGSKVTLLEIDFNELLGNQSKFREFRDTNPQTFEQVKELLKGIPGIKVDLNESVYIRFSK